MSQTDSVSQPELAYRRLRAADLRGRFQLGLTPIREALMRLSSENLVEGEVSLGARGSGATHAEFADLMATRRAVERLCLTASITRGGADWEAEVIAAMHLLSRAPLPASADDRAAAAHWEAQHRRFHAALVGACGSHWQLRFWNTLADHSERYRKLRLLRRHEAEAAVRDVNAEHRAILQAALDRDVARATGLMDAHLAATESSVSRMLAQTGSG